MTRRSRRPEGHATTPVPAVLARALARGARALSSALDDARRGEADGVHDARVAIRRLREAIAVADRAGTSTRQLERRLRRLARVMAPVRDLDVARATLDAAGAESWPPAIVAWIDLECERRATRLRKTMLAKIDALGTGALLADVADVRRDVQSMLDRDAGRSLASRVRARAGQLTGAVDVVGTLYVPQRLHDIRLAVKKLRYALELAPPSAVWRPGAARVRLRAAQGAFGALADLHGLQKEVHRLAATTAGGTRARAQALASVDQDLEAKCRAAHADVLRLLPVLRALAGRLLNAGALEALTLHAARMAPDTPASGRRAARL